MFQHRESCDAASVYRTGNSGRDRPNPFHLRGGLPGARWIDPENYHVTLRFIGDIDGISANEIASMLFRVNRKPFEVTVQGLSSFGGKKPRAVVANIAPSRPLIELQAELERLMQRIGLDPEGRKFTPACHAGAAARRGCARCRRLSFGARLFPDQGIHGFPLRVVFLPCVDRRWALCGRGFLRAERVKRLIAALSSSPGLDRATQYSRGASV